MSIAALSLAGWLFLIGPNGPVRATAAPAALDIQGVPQAIAAERGQSRRAPPVMPDRLVYRGRLDVPVTVAAAGLWIVAEAEKTRLAPVDCKWCDRAPDGTDTLNGLDAWGRRAFLWHHTGRAITASNITGFILAPAAAYGLDWVAASHDDRTFDAPADVILISQSMAMASDVTEIMKFAFGRERPFVHVLAPGARATTPSSADNNTSFPSGHTTLAFALATSSTAIARLRGYSEAPWLLRAGLPLAVLTAYFRMAADRHYVTDVLAGAGVGSAFGFGVPYLAHRAKTDHRVPTVGVGSVRGGEMVMARWEW